MSVKTFFLRLFKRNDRNAVRVPSLMEQMVSSLEVLAQKASALNDTWAVERETIIRAARDVRRLEPADEILAAKFEQDILGKITALSTACDAAIAGKKNAELKKPLAELLSSINQRRAINERQAASS